MRLLNPAGFVHNVSGQGWVISSLSREENGFDDILGPVCNKNQAVEQSRFYFPHIYLIEYNLNKKYDIFYINGDKMPNDFHKNPVQKDVDNTELENSIKSLLKQQKEQSIIDELY